MEIWNTVPFYQGYYEVSDSGNFRSVDRIVNGPHGSRLMKGKMLNIRVNKDGYVHAHFCKEGVNKAFSAHRIVALAFINNPMNYPEVNHKDGNKQNNHKDNLEWCTTSQNLAHSFAIGLRISSRNQGFNIQQVSLAGEIIGSFGSINEAARVTGIHKAGISKALRGKVKRAGDYKWIF